MIKKSIILLVILILSTVFSLHAQKVAMGVLAGANLNFITIKSDYTLSENYKPTPLLSYNTGYFLKTKFKKIGIMASGEYERTATKDNLEFVMFDALGDPIGSCDNKTINHEFLINTIGTYQLSSKIYCGTGISCSVLLISVLKFNDPIYSDGKDLGTHFQNYQYKPYSLSVPVIIGLNFNRLDLFLRFNKGIMNKINSKESFIKEYDNVLLLGIGYKFSKENHE